MRLVLLCSAFALAVTPLAQAQVLKRADDMAPIVAPPAKPPAKKVRRAPPAPAEGGPAAGTAARVTPQDVATCALGTEAAIAGCTKIIDAQQKPKGRADAFYNRGNAHAAKGDPTAAIADYDEAIRLEPKNPQAFNNRGLARGQKGEADAALADFSEAIKLNPRFGAAFLNRANVLAAQGETERALQDYGSAIRYDRRNVNAYLARGALLLAGGETAKARADMRQAAALGRRNAYAVLWHDIAERRGRQKGVLAQKNATRGLDMKAWPAPVIQLFAGETKADAVLAAADSPDAAVKTAQSCEASFYSGAHALIDGRRDEAVRLLRAAAKDCPQGFLEGIAAKAELKGLGEKPES